VLNFRPTSRFARFRRECHNQNRVEKICNEAGVFDFHFHDTRHSAITRMIRAGLPLVEVMKVSGHSTLAAFNIYANLEAESIFRAASALDIFLATANNAELTQNTGELIN
jgi:integrase